MAKRYTRRRGSCVRDENDMVRRDSVLRIDIDVPRKGIAKPQQVLGADKIAAKCDIRIKKGIIYCVSVGGNQIRGLAGVWLGRVGSLWKLFVLPLRLYSGKHGAETIWSLSTNLS